MASKITGQNNWKNNENLNARDYVHERDTISGTVNTIIDEQTAQDDLLEGLRTDVDDNTENIESNDTDITALQTGKVAKAGDTMTGALAFTAGQQAGVTRINMNNNKVVTTDGINATTFNNSDDDTDAVRYSELSNVFDVSLGSGSPNYQTTLKTNITSKFNEYAKISDLSTDFLRRDGTVAMTGNLNMGSQAITNVGNVDGVDVSQLKIDFDTIAAFFEVGDEDTAINRMQEIIDVFSEYQEGFDLATELATKMDKDGSNSALTGLTFNDEVTQATLTYDHDKKVLQITNGATLTINGDLVFAGGKAVGAIALGDVVQFAGSQGSHYLVKKAVGSEIAAQPELILGVAHETVADNEFVRVSWFGEVRGLDLSANQLGDILYFDVVNSVLTTTRPTTDPIIQLAAVTNNANNGSLLVRPKFISRKAQEIFVQAVANKFSAGNVQGLLEVLYDKIQTHESATNNPHSLTASDVGAEPAFTKNTAFNKNFGNIEDTVTQGNDARLSDARTPLSHNHTIGEVTGLQAALNAKPTIDAGTGKIPVSVIPFQFDDVLQGYIDQNVFYEEDTFVTVIPAEQGKLYIDISTNDIYRYDGTNYVLVKEAIGALGEVPDVIFTSLQSGQLLRYDGTNWVNDLLPLEDLENVVITNVADGQYLKYDNETSKWVNTALDAPVIDSLNAIADVEADSPSSGDILQYNAATQDWEKNRINFVSATAPTNPYVGDFWFDSSTLVLYVYYDDGDSVQWVNAVSGIVEGQPEELNDLTDVNVVSPTNGQVLTYNTSTQVFQNQDLPAETGLANVEYYTTTIATGNWSGTDPVTAVKTVSGVLSTDKPLIDIDLSSVAFANVEAKQTEYAKIFRVAATATNEVSFFATEAPTEELVIQIKVVR